MIFFWLHSYVAYNTRIRSRLDGNTRKKPMHECSLHLRVDKMKDGAISEVSQLIISRYALVSRILNKETPL